MKFSLSILTSGLFLATAAALPSFNQNVLSITFGALDDNILLNTTECAEPDMPKGTALSLTQTDCTQGTYPCHVNQGGTYTLTTTFICGKDHASLRGTLTATASGITKTVFDQTPDNVKCIAAQIVSIPFTFTVNQLTIPTNYDVVIKVSDASAAGPEGNEFCRKGEVVVDASVVIGAVNEILFLFAI